MRRRRIAPQHWRAPLLLLAALAAPAAPEANTLRDGPGERASIAAAAVDTCLDAGSRGHAPGRGARGTVPAASAGFGEIDCRGVCNPRVVEPAAPVWNFTRGNLYGGVELADLPTDWTSPDGALAAVDGASLTLRSGVRRPVLGWLLGGANLTLEGSLARAIAKIPDDVRYDQRLSVRLDRSIGPWDAGVEANFGSRSSIDLGRRMQSDTRYGGHFGTARTDDRGTRRAAAFTVSLSDSASRIDGYATSTAAAEASYEVTRGGASLKVGVNYTDGGDSFGSTWQEARGEVRFSTRF
jgi:hypothetical protein